jgi:TonB-linked SusC/RagA family outer membrane protein
LKDASAAAIYGARAMNGVVLITTKRGSKGEPILSVKASIGRQTVYDKLDVLNASQYRNYKRKIREGLGETGFNLPEYITNPGLVDTDWQDEIFRPATIQELTTQISGGSDFANYAVSVGYLNQEGVVKSTMFERFNVRINSDYKKGRFSFGESFSFSRVDDDQGVGNPVRAAVLASPLMPVFSDEFESGYGAPATSITGADTYPNPIALIDTRRFDVIRNNMLGNLYAQYEIIKGLNVKSSFSATVNSTRADTFLETLDQDKSAATRVVPNRNLTESFLNQWVWENTIGYNKNWNAHSLEALVGYTAQENEINNTRVTGTFENYNGLNIFSQTEPAVLDTYDAFTFISQFGRVMYNYDQKYYLTATLRRDGSSRFAPANKYGYFPGMSLGYRVSQERFFPKLSFVDDLKLRFGYGTLGNSEFANNFEQYSTISFFPEAVFLNGTSEQIINGASIIDISRGQTLQWESVETLNFGTDLSMFGDRWYVRVDYYKKVSNQILIEVGPAFVGGVGKPYTANGGQIENRGLELSTNYNTNIGELSIDIGGSISIFKNKVISLANQEFLEGGGLFKGDRGFWGATRTIPGNEIGAFYGYNMLGIFQTQEEINELNNIDGDPTTEYQIGARPGDVKFQDIDGDGDVDALDQTIIGSPIPSWSSGLNLGLDFKNFSLNIATFGLHDFENFNSVRRTLESVNNDVYSNKSTTVLNGWSGPGTSDKHPEIRADDLAGNDRLFSSRWIEDASFFRIQEIRLNYRLPTFFNEKLRIAGAQVYIIAENPLTVTKYTGLDPMVGVQGFSGPDGPTLSRGVDQGRYPMVRTIRTGLNLNF